MSQYKNSINIKEQNINNSIFQTNNKQDNNNEYYSSNYFLLNTNRNRNIDCNNIKKDPYYSNINKLGNNTNIFEKEIPESEKTINISDIKISTNNNNIKKLKNIDNNTITPFKNTFMANKIDQQKDNNNLDLPEILEKNENDKIENSENGTFGPKKTIEIIDYYISKDKEKNHENSKIEEAVNVENDYKYSSNKVSYDDGDQKEINNNIENEQINQNKKNDNQNYNNNSFLKNSKYLSNSYSNSQNNNKNELNPINNNDLNGYLDIYFIVEDKIIYIESEPGKKFSELINDLYSKYLWLLKKNITDFELNGKKLDNNLTVKQNGIVNEDKINIIIDPTFKK